MNRKKYGKMIGAAVILLLLMSMIGSIGIEPETNNLNQGILEYEPQFHDFGNMTAGECNSDGV